MACTLANSKREAREFLGNGTAIEVPCIGDSEAIGVWIAGRDVTVHVIRQIPHSPLTIHFFDHDIDSREITRMLAAARTDH